MTSPETGERRASLKVAILERLRDPLQLRICVISIVLLAGYGAIYMPLSERIADTTRKLKRDKTLLDLAGEYERLQEQYRVLESRIPKNSDNKEWVQYILHGIRQFPIKLANLDCRAPNKIGPFKTVVLQIELEGTFFDLDKFLRWLESNKRLIRTDDVRIAPTRGNKDVILMQISVQGLTS